MNLKTIFIALFCCLILHTQATAQQDTSNLQYSDDSLIEIARYSEATAVNTTPTKLDTTNFDECLNIILAAIAAAGTFLTAFLIRSEGKKRHIKKQFQIRLFLDLIRHLYRNKVVICALQEKFKTNEPDKHLYNEKYPSEEHLLKLKVLPEDLRLDRFDNSPEFYDILHELELKFRNFNYEVDVALEHLKIKQMDPKQKIRDLGVLEFKQQLLTVNIIEVMRKLGLDKTLVEQFESDASFYAEKEIELSKKGILLNGIKPVYGEEPCIEDPHNYNLATDEEQKALLDMLSVVRYKLIDTYYRYKDTYPEEMYGSKIQDRFPKDPIQGQADRRYYDEALGMTQILDIDIMEEIPKIWFINFPKA